MSRNISSIPSVNGQLNYLTREHQSSTLSLPPRNRHSPRGSYSMAALVSSHDLHRLLAHRGDTEYPMCFYAIADVAVVASFPCAPRSRAGIRRRAGGSFLTLLPDDVRASRRLCGHAELAAGTVRFTHRHLER
jgi:hypothetical protein